ncbi:hypothetical protein [Rhizobium sp. Leaf383]|uniref:hypothetical protein n=1 Tax=Rhizobium sp. Leaf383 TaxID=1736357 RepID=UPI0007143E05|nr:hypothetical protein [Rhizobium sp. Leaf383]KQS83444.1 hypothetical protein ASG58_22180 [Rhizobium sp. Leaf383]
MRALPGNSHRQSPSYAVSNLSALFTVCAAALSDVESWSDPVRESITTDIKHVLELGAMLASDACEAVEKLEKQA